MRIALVYSAYPPLEAWQRGDGGADYCRVLATHLAEEGHEMHVITGCAPGAAENTEQPQPGLEVIVHRAIRDWSPSGLLNGQYRRLSNALREVAPHVTLLIFPGGGLGCGYLLPALIPSMEPGRPVVTSLFTFLPARKPVYAPLFLAASAYLYSRSRLILFESMAQLKRMQRIFPSLAPRCEFMPTGCTMEIQEHYDAGRMRERRRRVGLDPGKRYLAFLGQMRRNKHPQLFLEAAQQVRARHGDLQILFIGGSGREALRSRFERRILRLIDDTGMADAVHFTGYTDEQRFNQFLLACDMCVLPFDERLGRSTLFVAMSAGMPMVTIARDDHMFLRHRESGYLVRSFQASDLAAGMEDVLTEPGLRERLSQGALAASEQVSWKRLARRWTDLMSAAASEHACPA
ncbi:MAG TPA: glycosyltransferase family 4 protein [Terriglobales bacterium]|nr:glycosyltransferase family 4 protein [Terriglobales bacterium]